MLQHLNFFYAVFMIILSYELKSIFFPKKITFLFVNYISLGKILLCVYFSSFGTLS